MTKSIITHIDGMSRIPEPEHWIEGQRNFNLYRYVRNYFLRVHPDEIVEAEVISYALSVDARIADRTDWATSEVISVAKSVTGWLRRRDYNPRGNQTAVHFKDSDKAKEDQMYSVASRRYKNYYRDCHILHLRAQGLSVREIGSEIGISSSQVSRICKRGLITTGGDGREWSITPYDPNLYDSNNKPRVGGSIIGKRNRKILGGWLDKLEAQIDQREAQIEDRQDQIDRHYAKPENAHYEWD